MNVSVSSTAIVTFLGSGGAYAMTAQEAREVRRQFNEADRLRVVLARQVVNAMTEGEVDGDVSVIFAPLFAECLGILRQEVGR